MTDNFIQSMMARTQARKDTLSRVSQQNNKENSESTNFTDEPKCESVAENYPTKSEPEMTTRAKIASPVKLSEAACIADKTTSKSRFKLLAERSRCMQNWEDDYTYHSVSHPKEVDKSTRQRSYAKISSMPSSAKSIPTAACSPSKYFFGCNASNVAKSDTSNLPSTIPAANVASPIKHAPALSSVDISPTKKLAWDSQLINSLEAQGYTPTSSQSRLVYNFPKETTAETGSKSIMSSSSNSESRVTEDVAESAETVDTPKGKSSSVSNLKNRWESAVRNASPERAIIQSQVSPQMRNPISPQKKYTFGSPQKSHAFTSGPIGRSAEKAVQKSPIRKRPISPYKPNPVGKIVKGEVPMADTVPIVTTEKASVRDKIAAFSGIAQSKPIERRDPVEMSVKDRLNIFERSNDRALIPKAPFGQCLPSESKSQRNQEPLESANYQTKGKGTEILPQIKDYYWKTNEIHEKARLGIEKDMDLLRNRFKKPYSVADEQIESDSEYPESESSMDTSPPQPPAKPPRVMTSPAKLDDGSSCSSAANSPVKRMNSTELDEANVSSLKEYEPRIRPGCLFPCLSDIESHSEAAMESQDEDVKETSLATTASGESLGTYIQRIADDKSTEVSEGLSTIHELTSNYKISSSAMGSETMKALEEIDDALEEALFEENQNSSPKRIKIDNNQTNSKLVTPVPSRHRSPETPLTHSISMYRKQKPAEVSITPQRKTAWRRDLVSPEASPISPSVSITTRIRALQTEEESDNSVVSQASKAVGMVYRIHTHLLGSDEHVAAEKLLLVSTQRRQASGNEIQRLKAEGALGRSTWAADEDASRGSISLSNLTLPLKQEFINKQMHQKAHHFCVLVKHRDQVISTEMLKTPQSVTEGAVTFPNLMSVHNLSSEFNIALEVYCLKADWETTNMKKEQSRLKLTPLRRMHKESKSSAQQATLPHDLPDRTPSFELVGFTNLNINTLTRNAWTLEKVPFNSPLDGHLLMRVSCTMEGGASVKNFLTMFEDVGGFGAWNRRWCVLSGAFVKYWRYPDEEAAKKDCQNLIDLRACTTGKVETVPWDVCARPHTFQLTLVRPVRKGDQTNLVQEVKDSALVRKILISADSKEERIEWCGKLNKALANLRAWDPDALKPEDFSF